MLVVPIGVDSETALIQAGNLTPPLVCLSTAERDAAGVAQTNLYNWQPALYVYDRLLSDPSKLLVIHNGPFDLGVACCEHPELIFKVLDAYNDDRICDTITLQKLIDIALGMRKFRRVNGRNLRTSYDLATLIELYYNEQVAKDDTWRLSYMLLRDIPVEQWPVNARTYAIYDSVLHLRLWEAQQRMMMATWGGQLPNQQKQQRTNFILHLMSMWGIRAEASRVEHFETVCRDEIAKMQLHLFDTCIRCGSIKKEHNDAYCATKLREDDDFDGPGFKNSGIFRHEKGEFVRTMSEIRRRVERSFLKRNMAVPYTDPSPKFPDGQIQTDKDTLEQTDDPYLHVLAESMSFAKHLGQWGPVLRAAVEKPVCCRYEILVETGRTASSGSEGQDGTNIQNPPRKGEVRPAIIPRKGWVFCSTDADTIELRAHAQNNLELVGWSRMAEALIEQARSKGPDLHEVLGAGVMGVDPRLLQAGRKAGDVAMNDARQFAKIPNFGFPGGLGAETFVAYAAGQLSREAFMKWFSPNRDEAVKKATRLREIWFETFPENRYYFEIVGKMIDRKKGYGTVQQLMSRRIRGQVRFTAAANGFFQGRVADAMKDILWRLGMECYTGRETAPDGTLTGGYSPLLGSRLSMFLHDEPILEHPEADAHIRAERQRQIVVETLMQWMPNIPCSSTAVLMRRWQKGAEALFACGCGKYNGKAACECGKQGTLVPVKPEKRESGVDEKTGEKKYKIIWVHDQGDAEPMALVA